MIRSKVSDASSLDFSIVLPVYNVEDYLVGCIESIIEQVAGQYEIIAIDDASTDGSLRILQGYESQKDLDMTIIALDENKGAGYARNKALEILRGEYTFYIDSDDLLEPDTFLRLLQSIKESRSDVIVFKYSLYHHDADGNYEKSGMLQMDERVWSELLQNKYSLSCSIQEKPKFLSSVNFPWNKIYRTEFIKGSNIKFTQTIVNNDIYFHWKTLIAAKEITFIDEYMYIHREFKSRQQITNYFDERRFDMFIALAEVDNLLHSNEKYIDSYYHYFLLFKLDLLRWALKRMPENLRDEFLQKTKKSMSLFSRRDFMLGAHKMPTVYSDASRIKLESSAEFT